MKLTKALAATAAIAALAAGSAVAAPDASKPGRSLEAKIDARAISVSTATIQSGQATLAVRNTSGDRRSFEILRHSGGVATLPFMFGSKIAPAEKIVRWVEYVAPGKQANLSVKLAPGRYLLVSGQAGTTSVQSGVSFRVR